MLQEQKLHEMVPIRASASLLVLICLLKYSLGLGMSVKMLLTTQNSFQTVLLSLSVTVKSNWSLYVYQNTYKDPKICKCGSFGILSPP